MRRFAYGLILLVPLAGGCGGEKPADNGQKPPAPPGAVAAQPGPARQGQAGEKALGDYVTFPSAGLEIRRPAGFEKAPNFDGFEQADTQSSILAMSTPVPFKDIIAGFTQLKMSGKGWTLLSRTEHKVQDFDGLLVHVKQPEKDVVLLKWTLAFGDGEQTRLVTATFPQSRELEMSQMLRLAVLSTRPSGAAPAGPGADLPFTITDSKQLKRVPGVSRMLLYTKDGAFPPKLPDDPLFTVAPAIGEVVGSAGKRRFAEEQLRGIAQIAQLSIQSTEPIKIDGLEGFESLAKADDVASEKRAATASAGPSRQTPLTVYQVVLFDEKWYVVMQGLVGRDRQNEYLPEFKAMARSFHRKQ